MFRSLMAGLVIASLFAPVRTSARENQPSVHLDESSAAVWVGKAVEIRLVTDRLIVGTVESVDAHALMLREASGSVRRVPYDDVAGIGTSNSERPFLPFIFAGPGALFRGLDTLHAGIGFERIAPTGFGGGGEIGYLSYVPGGLESGMGIASVNAVYDDVNSDRRFTPFVSGGYTLMLGRGVANGINFGGGFNYWSRNDLALRVEFRDHMPVYRDDREVPYMERARRMHMETTRVTFCNGAPGPRSSAHELAAAGSFRAHRLQILPKTQVTPSGRTDFSISPGLQSSETHCYVTSGQCALNLRRAPIVLRTSRPSGPLLCRQAAAPGRP